MTNRMCTVRRGLTILFTAIIVTAACTQGPVQSVAPTPSGAVASAQTPSRGGTAVLAIGADPTTLNPAISQAQESLAVGCKIFNGLVWIDRSYSPQPELAKSWEVSSDNLKITFHLQDGVQWHDGTPFTSDDVKFTFEEVLAKFHPRTSVAFRSVSGVQAPDPLTVVVTFHRPYAPFLVQMSCLDAPILPKRIYSGTDILQNPRNTDAPVGTGPFKWGTWARGDHIRLVRNDRYFRSGQPYLDAVVLKVVPDASSRISALRKGDVDFIQSFFLPKDQVQPLRQDTAVKLMFDTDLPGNVLMFFNTSRTPVDRPEVRRALTTGLNRQQIAQQAFFGIGEPGKSAIHRAIAWASNPAVDYSVLYPFDSTRANTELDAAGYRRAANGTRLRIRLAYNVSQNGAEATAQIIRDNWNALGIETQLEPQDSQLNQNAVFIRRDYDIALSGYTTGGDPAIGIARTYVTAPVPTVAFTNPTGYSNSSMDALWARGASTLSRDERQKAYYEAQQVISQELPTLNLIDRKEVDAARVSLQGLWTSVGPFDRWDQVWLRS